MAEKGVLNQEQRLWRQYRAGTGEAMPAAPDALTLAAYAEGRVDEAEAAPVEAWLAADPVRISDILAARAASTRPPQLVYQTIVANACGLVTAAGDEASVTVPAGDNVVPLRRRPASWRSALAWSGIAASLLCASLAGFSMGSSAYTDLSPSASGEFSATDSLDTPASLDSYFGDDSGT